MTADVVWATSAIPGMWPPSSDPSTLSRQVWDGRTARSIPGVGRALGIYGMLTQCALLHYKTTPGDPTSVDTQLATTRMLQRPDPDMGLPTFIGVHLEDFLLHGNAAHLITSRGGDGTPATVRWFPAHQWGIQEDRFGQPIYTVNGRTVNRDDVVHVRRGADPYCTWRGVGVVEQHLATLNRAGLEEAAETANLRGRGMPAVAIIKPNDEHDPDNDDAVAVKWEERFGTSQKPKPAIFPKGTQVVPLSWNPTDQELVAARAMTLKDIANAFNLDGYYVNAEGGSHNYKSPQPMFLTLIRTSLGPVMRTFEEQWSFSWLPYGRTVKLDRAEMLRDDLQTMIQTFTQGHTAGIFPDVNEIRAYMGWRPLTAAELEAAKPPPPAPPAPPTADPTADPEADPAPAQEG